MWRTRGGAVKEKWWRRAQCPLIRPMMPLKEWTAKGRQKRGLLTTRDQTWQSFCRCSVWMLESSDRRREIGIESKMSQSLGFWWRPCPGRQQKGDGGAGYTALVRAVAPVKNSDGLKVAGLLPGCTSRAETICAWENGDRSHLVSLQTRKSEVLPRRLPERKVLACTNPRVERFNKEEKWRSGSDLKHRDKSLSNNRWPGSPDGVVTKILQGLSTKLENEASSYLAVSLLLWK